MQSEAAESGIYCLWKMIMREGENGNSSVTFMMDVKTDPRGRPEAK